MDNKKQNIPLINDEIDIGLLLNITRQNVLLIVILFTFFAFVAFLYLRFTPPVYQSAATVQLGHDTRTNALLQTTNIYSQTIHEEIEFLRSPVAIGESLAKLPLDISYMIKGEILSSELYRASPYSVDYKVINNDILNQPINVKFLDNFRVYLEYTIGDVVVAQEASMLDTIKTNDLTIKITPTNLERIFQNQNDDQNQFYFVLNSQQSNLNKYLAKLEVEILNEFAKTINIKVKDHNALKTKDIVNQIANDFIESDKLRKQKSSSEILKFIDSQLARIYDRLYESENNIKSFRQAYNIDPTKDNSRALPSVDGRLEELEKELLQISVEENILSDVEKEVEGNKDLDVYRLVSLLAGSQYEGTIATSLKNLQNLLLQREQMLYVVKENSDQVKALNYQIGIQKKLIIESLASVRQSISNERAELNKQLGIYKKLAYSGGLHTMRLNTRGY